MPGFSLDQLTQVPHVMGVISEYNAVGSTISRYYNIGMNTTPSQTILGRTGVYDVFNPTRTMPVGRAPMAGPSRVARRPIGQKMITTPRYYEAVEIEYERVYRNRPLGGRYGTVDAMGQNYIARQLKVELDKFAILHEFTAISMFRGGWAYLASGEDLYPVPLGTPDAIYPHETLVDAAHKDQIPLGPGSANIIDQSWDDPDTMIIQQFLALDKVHAARHGAPLRHVWGNGTTIGHLFNNLQLQRVGGTSFRIFDSMSNRELDPNQKYPDTGVDIVFRGLPQIRFHIYNQVYIPGLVSNSFAAQIDSANVKYFIPDGEVIITPDPGDYCEVVAGTEPVQFNLLEAVRMASGFAYGREWAIDPPRVDLKFLYNGCPVLTQPRATYNPTVIFV